MLKTAIIDDDKLSRFVLKKYIDKTNFLHFQKEYESAIDAAENPEINTADIIILDVEMPSFNSSCGMIQNFSSLRSMIVLHFWQQSRKLNPKLLCWITI